MFLATPVRMEIVALALVLWITDFPTLRPHSRTMRFPKGALNIATTLVGGKHGLTQTCNGTAGTSHIEIATTFSGHLATTKGTLLYHCKYYRLHSPGSSITWLLGLLRDRNCVIRN